MASEVRADLGDILGFRSTPSLGKYLGFPIKHSAISQEFGFIIERVQTRLAEWKANLLSFAGRLVLTQPVTTTIPNYAMQCIALPANILNSIDRLSHNCKVEFIQPSNWLYSVPNLLVIQHLVTLYLGGFDVRVVSEIE